MNVSLKDKARSGILWTGFETLSIQGASFIIGIILARLLNPSDYGLIGILTVFLAFANILSDSGLASALIQNKHRSEVDYATAFFFNLSLSILLYLVLFFVAPWLSIFFNAGELTSLTRILGLGIIISSFTLIQETKLRIEMRFRYQAKVSILASLMGGVLGISAAYLGFGVWALVIQNLGNSFVRMLTLVYLIRWFPIFVFSKDSFKKLFNFGSKLLIASLLAEFFNNIYSFLIARLFSVSELGYYTRARQLPEIISNNVVTIIRSVSYPVLSVLQDEKQQFSKFYKDLIRLSGFAVFPTITFLLILAEPFIRFLFTEKWLPAVPFIQWICIARLFTPISSINLTILQAIGRSDLFLKVDSSKILLNILALIVTIPLGMRAIVIGHAVLSFVSYFINTYYAKKIFDFGPLKQIFLLKDIITSTFIMGVVMYIVTELVLEDPLKLLSGSISGILVFIGLAKLFRMPELQEAKNILYRR